MPRTTNSSLETIVCIWRPGELEFSEEEKWADREKMEEVRGDQLGLIGCLWGLRVLKDDKAQ